MTVVTVCASTVVLAARPVGADTVASAQAKAAAIEATLTAAQNQMSTLSQEYDEAQAKLGQVDSNIATTKAAIAANRSHVAADKSTLEKAAVSNYVSDGSAASQNPIFSNNQKTASVANEYSQIASGNLDEAVDNLHTAENTLSAQESQLNSQRGQAQAAVSTEQAAVSQNAQVVQQQSAALAQENGEIATLVQQQQQAEAAQAAAAAQAKITTAAAQQAATQTASASSSTPVSGSSQAQATFAPPAAAGGEGAVQAAETQLGVPYVWGGETPGVGFDCSGLTAWAWGQVGVSLPHYSGSQFADSTPVPITDLEPGDLLFYGPGGDEHVAMYVSPGTMIEAPETGQVVHLTPIRLGDGFVGAGRP